MVLPDTDEAIAKAILHEAVKIALGPGNTRTKMAALKIVLDFTRPKPGNASWSLAERRAIGAEGAGGCCGRCWEAELLADAPLATPVMGATPPEGRP